MRPLDEEEVKQVFEKLHKYIGKAIKSLVDQEDDPHCFRLHKNRVYYVREEIMRRAVSISRKNLVSMGTCLGKFTHSGKFILTIHALQVISQYAKYKVWVKPSAEMSYLYGNHVLKTGLARITENTPAYQGVVVMSMSDIPLGFGTSARSTQNLERSPLTLGVFVMGDNILNRADPRALTFQGGATGVTPNQFAAINPRLSTPSCRSVDDCLVKLTSTGRGRPPTAEAP